MWSNIIEMAGLEKLTNERYFQARKRMFNIFIAEEKKCVCYKRWCFGDSGNSYESGDC